MPRRNFKYIERHKIKKKFFICWHRSNSWGICNSALIRLPPPLPPRPPALALKFSCVVCLKGIPSCLCLWRLLAPRVWSTSNSGWSGCGAGQGPAVHRKMCSKVFKGSEEVGHPSESPGAIDQCPPTLL